MTVQMINQNAQSLLEISQNYDSLVEEKKRIALLINNYKLTGKKAKLKQADKELQKINSKMDDIKYYIIKLLVNMQKLIEEEKKKDA